MPEAQTPSDWDPLDAVAEEFLLRIRRGERPSVTEYCEACPEMAAEIRETLRALLLVEDLKGESISGPPPEMIASQASSGPRMVGDYTLLRELGRGGMGVVYEAEQRSLGRRVALKVLPPTGTGEARAITRFQLEARVAARLHHTNIVPIFEVGQDGETLFFAMQIIRGTGLDRVIDDLRRLRGRGPEYASWPADAVASSWADSMSEGLARSLLTGRLRIEGGPAPELDRPDDDPSGGSRTAPPPSDAQPTGKSRSREERATSSVTIARADLTASGPGRDRYCRSVARVGLQVAEALAHAHARGIVHRDIKPSNLLLDTDGVVWVADFGLAKEEGTDGLTRTGDILGTLRYMDPGRFEGHADARSDIYSLGATLYELLTLRPAFDESSRARLVDRVLHAEPPPPRSIDRRIPRDLETIVQKAMAKAPSQRYRTAEDLADDLRRFLGSHPVRARRITAAEKLWMWARRNPAMAGLLLLVVGSLATGTATSMTLAARARDRAREATTAREEANADRRRAEAGEREALRARDRETSAARALARKAAEEAARRAHADGAIGEIDRAAFGLIDALILAPTQTGSDRAYRLALRRDLASWHDALPVLRHVLEDVDRIVGFQGPHKTILAYSTEDGHRLHLLDLVDGEPVGDPGGITFPEPVFATNGEGTLALTGGHDRETPARLREVATGRLLGELPTHGAVVRSAEFWPGGRHVLLTLAHSALARYDFRVMAWRLEPPGRVATSRILDVPSRMRDEGELISLSRLLVTRDGHDVLALVPDHHPSGRDQGLSFYDLDDDHVVSGVELEVDARGAGWIFDGFDLIIVGDDGRVRTWDPATGRPTPNGWRPLGSMAGGTLTTDGRTLAAFCGDWRVRFFDLTSRRECGPTVRVRDPIRNAPYGHRQRVTYRTWNRISPGGMFILSETGPPGMVGVWQVPGPLRPMIADAEREQGLYSYAEIRPDGRAAIAGRVDTESNRWLGTEWSARATAAQEFDLERARPAGPPTPRVYLQPTYSPDGRLFAGIGLSSPDAARGTRFGRLIQAYDTDTSRPAGPPVHAPQYVHALAMNSGGTLLAAGMVAGTGLYDLESRRMRSFFPQAGPITHVRFSPDGRWLAAVARGGWTDPAPALRVWDIAAGRPAGPAMSLPDAYNRARYGDQFFRFSGDSEVLIVLDPAGRRIHRWVAATRSVGPPVAIRGADEFGSSLWDLPRASIRPDGSSVFLVLGNATLRQFDAETGRPLGPVLDHPSTIALVAHSRDSSTLATACLDGSIRLWDTATGLELGPTRYVAEPIIALAFVPGARALRGLLADGSIYTCPVPAPVPADAPDALGTWIEATVGLRRDDSPVLTTLDAGAWRSAQAVARTAGLSPSASPRTGLVRWHRGGAMAAEVAGDWPAARRHLDHLDALLPDDWTAAARHGRTYSESGRLDEAAAAYQRAAGRATIEELISWYWWRAHACADLGRGATALWYLDRVATLRPDDWRVPALHARILARSGDGAAADAARLRAAELDADWFNLHELASASRQRGTMDQAIGLAERAVSRGGGRDAMTHLALLTATRGDHAKAASLLEEARRRDSAFHETFGAFDPVDHLMALTSLMSGRDEEYANVCSNLSGRVDWDASSPSAINGAVWTCVLAPVSSPPAHLAVEMAESALGALPEGDSGPRSAFLNTYGAALYRDGQHDAAIRSLEEGIDARGGAVLPQDDAFLAMAHAAAGRIEEARRLLARLEAAATHADEAPSWDRLEAEYLSRQAKAVVLDAAFPAEVFAVPAVYGSRDRDDP